MLGTYWLLKNLREYRVSFDGNGGDGNDGDEGDDDNGNIGD